MRSPCAMLQILEGVQALLDDPNNSDPAQNNAYQIYRTNKVKYRECVPAPALTSASCLPSKFRVLISP